MKTILFKKHVSTHEYTERTNLSPSFRDWFQKEGKIKSKAKPYSWKSLQADKLQGKQNTLFKN